MAAASEQGPPQAEPESEPKPEPEQSPAQPEPEQGPAQPEPEPEPEPKPEAELLMNVESNGKENLKTKRRKSFPAKQEHVECVLQNTPILPCYMAATESAKAKLRAQAVSAEDGGENGFIRRHSLPLSTGKLSLQSPGVQKPLQANGKGWNKSNKAQICTKDDKMVQTGWKRRMQNLANVSNWVGKRDWCVVVHY